MLEVVKEEEESESWCRVVGFLHKASAARRPIAVEMMMGFIWDVFNG